MKKFLFMAVSLFFLQEMSVYAVKVLSLYQVELPVISQASDVREQAMKEGLLQVLTKLSGDRSIAQLPIIKLNLKKAGYYVSEYSYAPATTTSSEYTLQIRYDRNDINRLLQKANITYWGEDRPLILVWLIANHEQQAIEIINNDSENNLATLLKTQSKSFGLPLILPIMDVTDMSQISAEDIATRSLPILKEVSKRYRPEALLIGNVDKHDHTYQSEWHLIFAGREWQWTIIEQNDEAVIHNLLNEIYKTLANYNKIAIKQAKLPLQQMNLPLSKSTQYSS